MGRCANNVRIYKTLLVFSRKVQDSEFTSKELENAFNRTAKNNNAPRLYRLAVLFCKL